jgi:hypothetical protein
MVSFYGDYDLTETVVIPFNAFSSDDPSASITVTNLASTDVYIYKDGSLTQRTSFAGIAVDIDVDAIVGNHWVTIDLSDDTDVGFYVAGSRYQVRMEGVTIDGATINAWIGAFSIGCTLRPTTAGRTVDVNATGEVGLDLDNTSGTIDAAQLGADCITSAKIANDAISSEHINTGALTADAFAANALVAATFAASSLDGKGNWNTVVPDAAGTVPIDGTLKVDIETIKTRAVTCGAGVTVYAHVGTAAVSTAQTGDGYSYLTTNLGALGANATEAGGTGDQLTNIPWSSNWDDEVQTEVTNALNTYDPPTNTQMEAAFTEIKGATWASGTDTLEAIRDHATTVKTDTAAILLANPTVIKAAAATGTLSTTQCTSTLTHADDRLVGRKIVFTAGTASGQAGLITGYANASGLVTWIPAMAIAPADGDTFEIHDFDSGLITRAATYQAGAIWIDTTNGVAGTVDYVNGTSTNPTDSIADANTLATSVGIVRFNVAPASSITLAASQDNQIFTGSAWFLVLNGQSVNLSTFEGAVVTGTGTGIGTWNNCVFGTCTLGGATVFRNCVLGDSFFGGTITLGSAAVYTFLNCTSNLPGPVGVTIDFGAAIGNSTVNLTGFEGSVTIANLGATGTDVLVVTGDCEVTLAASCTGGTVFLNGNIGFTNNGSGQTIYQDARFELSRILSDSTAFDGADIAAILVDTGTTIPALIAALPAAGDVADAVWDEAYVDHAGVGSYGILVGAAFEEV